MGKVAVSLAGKDEGKAHTYEGNHDVALGPDGILIVNEVVPDVTGKSETGTTNKIRTLYNNNAWTTAMIGD